MIQEFPFFFSLVSKKEEVVVASPDYEETPEDSLPAPGGLKATTRPSGEDPYFNGERRTWVDGKEAGHLINGMDRTHFQLIGCGSIS